jgi:AraC-like DNA-binding protein
MNTDTNNNKHGNIEAVLKCTVHSHTGKKQIIPPHQHFDYEFIYLLKGTYNYQHNKNHFQLKPGCGFLVRPGDWHTDHLYSDTDYIAINFVLRTDKLNLLQNVKDENLLRFEDKKKTIKQTLQKLLAESASTEPFSTCLQEAYLLELYWTAIRLLPREIIPNELLGNEEKVRFQQKLQHIFHLNVHAFPSLEFFASQMHLSPRTLNNGCRNAFGISPVKAFMKTKMDYSLELITNSSMSIKEISEYLGFQNPYHFSKTFKRFFDHPPTKIRKINKN